MSQAFEVFKERLVGASPEEVKNLIQQIERSRENGDISEREREQLKEIANRNLDAKGDEAYGRLDDNE
ncbi:hypothetical protein GCM10008932_14310 [Alkalibacterium iburiense]|uniref:Uncharacterized protein n=1 Tax=Alkalibacterium iburiense TaxID=290589 RepID=A0ABP3H746_9LACT